MGLERRADGEGGLRVSVQDVNQLILLDRGDEARPALRVASKVLSGNYPPYAGLPERLKMDPGEAVLSRHILQDRNPSRVSRENEIV